MHRFAPLAAILLVQAFAASRALDAAEDGPRGVLEIKVGKTIERT